MAKTSLRSFLSPIHRSMGRASSRVFIDRAKDPAALDLTKKNLQQKAARPSRIPVSAQQVLYYGEPFEYHGKLTKSYGLQAVAKILRRPYIQIARFNKIGVLPPPAVVLVVGKVKRPQWILPQVWAMHRFFRKVHTDLRAKGYSATRFNEAMLKHFHDDAEKSVVRFLNSGNKDEFERFAGELGVIWESRD